MLSPGQFLLHAESGGSPHCVGLDVDGDMNITVFDGSEKLSTTAKQIITLENENGNVLRFKRALSSANRGSNAYVSETSLHQRLVPMK